MGLIITIYFSHIKNETVLYVMVNVLVTEMSTSRENGYLNLIKLSNSKQKIASKMD